MKKLVLTTLAKNELKNLVKIQDQLEKSDIDLYFDFSSYDELLFDMQIFVEAAYVENAFERIEDFAIEISFSLGIEYNNVLERINKAIELNLVEVK